MFPIVGFSMIDTFMYWIKKKSSFFQVFLHVSFLLMRLHPVLQDWVEGEDDLLDCYKTTPVQYWNPLICDDLIAAIECTGK